MAASKFANIPSLYEASSLLTAGPGQAPSRALDAAWRTLIFGLSSHEPTVRSIACMCTLQSVPFAAVTLVRSHTRRKLALTLLGMMEGDEHETCRCSALVSIAILADTIVDDTISRALHLARQVLAVALSRVFSDLFVLPQLLLTQGGQAEATASNQAELESTLFWTKDSEAQSALLSLVPFFYEKTGLDKADRRAYDDFLMKLLRRGCAKGDYLTTDSSECLLLSHCLRCFTRLRKTPLNRSRVETFFPYVFFLSKCVMSDRLTTLSQNHKLIPETESESSAALLCLELHRFWNLWNPLPSPEFLQRFEYPSFLMGYASRKREQLMSHEASAERLMTPASKSLSRGDSRRAAYGVSSVHKALRSIKKMGRQSSLHVMSVAEAKMVDRSLSEQYSVKELFDPGCLPYNVQLSDDLVREALEILGLAMTISGPVLEFENSEYSRTITLTNTLMSAQLPFFIQTSPSSLFEAVPSLGVIDAGQSLSIRVNFT